MTSTPRRRGADRTEAIMRTTVELGQEIGYPKLSIEAIAARAGVGKHTIYRRWSSKGALLLDSLLSLDEPELDFSYTDDVLADLREQAHAAVELLARPPVGPLVQALIAEAQHDPQVAAELKERFINPMAGKLVKRLRTAQEQGHLSPDFDLDLAMSICSGPLYFQFLIIQEPITREYVNDFFGALFTGMSPRPAARGKAVRQDR
ncbi:TetR/AcrR family transcriptional regulator [Streptomyces sp. YC504]|uniref:TetR/AcrR family transcriptional regulator n=1 Tax=Streptomyces mesophilus TaxID=1775132 RepID=A0A6G4XL04_9ACTN|nr:TetR/AcrR family transcriptional regulator [Streptomyces mesophilus]NGO78225.1 TetR/AcrR family transcriptional regulator [Streptomyces mesophilus]